MKKMIGLIAGLLMVVGLVGATTQSANADAPLTLNWGSELNAAQCDGGDLVVNVTHGVVNDLDSGLGGWWASDSYQRRIQISDMGDGTFCALVQYHGTFTTLAGPSPGNTDVIEAGITGILSGGYRQIITGTLDLDPDFRTRGNLGTFDYECDAEAGPSYNTACTGLFRWQSEYFDPAPTRSTEWWGYSYHTGNNGTWINSVAGSEGDIIN
ncbi:MAG: hypothetical protein HOH95_14375 [Dehalococcoidia bacterium]|jgi:hypothetical protein|nr:hypothetical protein [Dehalococcoidia bacterium]